MTVLDERLTTEVASPEYERFLALNIQVPVAKGKQLYQRVTISCSLRDLADDLSQVLPSYIGHILRKAHDTHDVTNKSSHHRLASPNPKRDPYEVVCSCRKPECDHVQYAIGHFERVMAFSRNAGQIAEHLRINSERANHAERQRTALAQQLENLRQERDQLDESLKSAEIDVQMVGQLRAKLNEKEDEILYLSDALDKTSQEVDHYRQEAETATDNLNSMSRAWLDSGRRAIQPDQAKADDEVMSVVQTHFALAPSNVDPAAKLQVNVSADHHRVDNTHKLIIQLAQIDFVRELGIDRRHNIKSGKVQLTQDVNTLQVLVPHKGQADIIRVLTTASSKPQQMLAAYLIAARFDLDVKL